MEYCGFDVSSMLEVIQALKKEGGRAGLQPRVLEGRQGSRRQVINSGELLRFWLHSSPVAEPDLEVPLIGQLFAAWCAPLPVP